MHKGRSEVEGRGILILLKRAAAHEVFGCEGGVESGSPIVEGRLARFAMRRRMMTRLILDEHTFIIVRDIAM